MGIKGKEYDDFIEMISVEIFHRAHVPCFFANCYNLIMEKKIFFCDFFRAKREIKIER